ncbi:MAG: cytochrome C biogenesis protein [Anaerolineales bacterium]|nr:MAG: cytochrome C biogenesis protein [Anaerolineales bacterium]
MIADFGYGVLLVTFLVTVYSVFAAIYGEFKKKPAMVESARRAMLLTWPLLTLTAGILIYLLINNHFEVQFVYEVTSRSMPTYLKVTAWWGGQAGSLLFWSWLMSAFASLVTLRKWDRDREFLPWVIVVASVTMAFFIGMNVFFENPFAKLYQSFDGQIAPHTFQPANSILFTPRDGQGLNPLLRHPGMVIHPPMLYLGFVSFVIPYAFALAALITGRTDDRWIRLTRRWALWAWLFLSAGLVLGGRWAYDVLGWGGYWGWDPVEIAAFMPWLTGTAFLHSVMIQEKRGMLKHWNMLLVILTYDLVIFGTFLTRSGVLSSVHAFAQSAIGPLFFAFIGLTLITSVALLIYRWDSLKSETKMTSMLSREALFLLNNLLFMSILVVCFWGVIYPLISELFTGQKVTVGPPFYERATSPLFATLMLLMGIAPLSAWGHSTVKTLGRAIWKPTVGAVIITAVLYATYTQNIIALIGFFLVALVILVTLYEYWRGAYARQRSQDENILASFWNLTGRNRRRYGGYIIHLSMMLMAIGILGIEIFQVETQGTIAVGDSLQLSGYTIKYKEVASWDDRPSGVNYTRAVVEVYDKDGKYLGNLNPRKDYYYDSQQPMTIPGQLASLKDEVYVLLIDWEPISPVGTTFKVFVNPLVNWLWLGSLLFLVGVIIAAWPDKDPERVAVRAGKRAHQTSAAD